MLLRRFATSRDGSISLMPSKRLKNFFNSSGSL